MSHPRWIPSTTHGPSALPGVSPESRARDEHVWPRPPLPLNACCLVPSQDSMSCTLAEPAAPATPLWQEWPQFPGEQWGQRQRETQTKEAVVPEGSPGCLGCSQHRQSCRPGSGGRGVLLVGHSGMWGFAAPPITTNTHGSKEGSFTADTALSSHQNCHLLTS